jgi:2-deoxy-D-gluconate 3-dehydrogenase
MQSNGLFCLEGCVAIVTGGSQGLGFQMAKTLAGAGAKTVIVNRTKTEGKTAEKKIRNSEAECLAISADVSNEADVKRVISKALEYYQSVDILVNCAGINIRKPALQFKEKEWDKIIDINLKGTFLCCQAAGRIMVEQKRGKIINISSTGALTALELRGPYCAAKGGVTQLTKVLALEWAPYNVNVNAIAPGAMITPLTSELLKEGSEQREKHLRKIPLGRFGQPADLSGIVLFLASSASDYITGQTIFVDGGYTIW